MTGLIKKYVTFWWRPKKHATFETLRQKLCEAPILTLPKVMDDYVVYCDASIMRLGIVVMHRGHVITYVSR